MPRHATGPRPRDANPRRASAGAACGHIAAGRQAIRGLQAGLGQRHSGGAAPMRQVGQTIPGTCEGRAAGWPWLVVRARKHRLRVPVRAAARRLRDARAGGPRKGLMPGLLAPRGGSDRRRRDAVGALCRARRPAAIPKSAGFFSRRALQFFLRLLVATHCRPWRQKKSRKVPIRTTAPLQRPARTGARAVGRGADGGIPAPHRLAGPYLCSTGPGSDACGNAARRKQRA